MHPTRTVSVLSSVILIVFTCVTTSIAVTNALAWSNSLGSGTIEGTYSLPIYGPMVVPDGHGFGAGGKLGADHASLFFTAKDYLARATMYDPTVDPWGRTAETFPPHVVFLTAHSTARFDFLHSALLNNFAQILLFVVVFAYFVRDGSSSRALKIGGVAAGAFSVFCTPIGVTWFERAQTDLYCASAILLLLKGMRDDTWVDFVLAGLVGSLKWSSLPFFAIAALPYVFLASEQRARRIALIGVSLSVPFVLLLFFGEDARRYLTLVFGSELGHLGGPVGVSMSLYFPRPVAKAIPFAVPLFFVLAEKLLKPRTNTSSAELIFWVTAGLVASTFGTTAYEYRFLSTVFILPLVIDGRSILFSKENVVFSNVSRAIGIVFLAYALRVETTTFVDWLISHHRALVPLVVGVLLILVCSLLDWRSYAGRRWGTGVRRAPVS